MRLILLTLLPLFLTACFGSSEPEPKRTALVPLAENKVSITTLWQNDDLGIAENTLDQGLQIGANNNKIFIARDHLVYAINKRNGATIWKSEVSSQHKTRTRINQTEEGILDFLFGKNNAPDEGNYNVTITGGPSADAGLVVVGALRGEVTFLNEHNGQILKQTNIGSTVLSPPLLSEQKQALLKTTDSKIISLHLKNADINWQYSQINPPLTIRGIAPIISHDEMFISGFDNGRLIFLAEDGGIIDEKIIALPQGKNSLQRIVDINAAAIIDDNHVYAASYQGRAAAINLEDQQIKWLVDFSSLLGGGVIANTLYLIDDKNVIHGLSKSSGITKWQQPLLKDKISAPALAHRGFIVVADVDGYLHWLDAKNGALIGRAKAANSGINKLRIIDDVIYVLDERNVLSAIKARINHQATNAG